LTGCNGRRRRWLGPVLLLGIGLGLAGSARAQAPSATNAASAADAKTRAQEHLSRGNDLFTSDRFQDALIQFQAAYTAFPSPKLHFNIGQCQRALGRLSEALAQFRLFVEETPDIPSDLRAEAERYIAELKNAEATQRSIAPVPRPAVPPVAPLETLNAAALPPAAPTPLLAPPAKPDGQSPPIYKRWWFWTTIAVVAAGTVGAVLLLRPHDPKCQPGVVDCF
jgi:tetratricopeptide (TPR) repeat protein